MCAFSRFWRFACALAVMLAVAPLSIARAEAPSPRAIPVHVLSIDSDDAEDQADALSGALRSRVRMAPGWSLQETSHSLSMLTAALRCPTKPDASCLQRIGDQIHADRFVWGSMSKAPGNLVTADVHLWSRGKPDANFKESYSDNLKDQNDESLRKIATRIFDRLAGVATSGTITLHAGDAGGQITVNGQKKAVLVQGLAILDLPAGSYLVEVHTAAGTMGKQQVTVNAGSDTPVTLKLVPEKEEAPVASSGKPAPVRKIVGWTAVGVGGVLIAVGIVEGVRFLGLKDDLNSDRSHVDKNVTDVCAPDQTANPFAVDACNKFHDAKSARTLGLVLGGVGIAAAATGVILLVTDHGQESPEPAQTASKGTMHFTPYASHQGAGFDFKMTF